MVKAIPTPSGDDMLREVKARFSNGKLEPLEDLALSEGDEVTILVRRPPNKEAVMALIKTKSRRTGDEPDGFDRAAGAWKGTLDFDAFLADVHARRKLNRPMVDLDK